LLAEADMKILLQQVRSRLYFRSMGVWTVYAQWGFDFQNSQRAIEFAAQHGITGVQLVVQAPGAPDEIVPMPDLTPDLQIPAAA
jgi:hypothetical protein